jgi:menaquinone-dependent protoporphyrinogen oxidase
VKILVAYASRYGSTRDIAEFIADRLRTHSFDVTAVDVESVKSIEDTAAVVLGSAIYIGQWQKPARAFIEQFSADLLDRDVWMFSSGPIGDDPFPRDEPPETADLIEKTGARDYRSFAGKLDKSNLSFEDRVVSTVVRAPEGDFRSWEEIGEWADQIAIDLAGRTTSS